MSPSDAIKQLLALPEWSEVRIAREAGISQPTVNRIKNGSSPAYDTGIALVALAKRCAKPAKSRAA